MRTSACLDALVDQAVTKGKKSTRSYTPKLFVPIQDSKDRHSIYRWKQQFSKHKSSVFGLVEGFLDGNVEVLLFPDRLAVVTYHVAKRESLPVTLPLGFVTEDPHRIKVISGFVEDYISGVVSFDNPRDLGPLSKL